MFCIWKNKFLSPQPCISHSVNHFFRNFLVILIFFQMFPGLSSVMLSNYCWNIYCTRIKCSILFWETWHFNSSAFCHLGIWYIFLVIEFWKISAKYCTHLWKSLIVYCPAGTDPGFVGSLAYVVWEAYFKKGNTKLQIQKLGAGCWQETMQVKSTVAEFHSWPLFRQRTLLLLWVRPHEWCVLNTYLASIGMQETI